MDHYSSSFRPMCSWGFAGIQGIHKTFYNSRCQAFKKAQERASLSLRELEGPRSLGCSYSRSQKVGTSLSSCPSGILALILLKLCSNFLASTVGFMWALHCKTQALSPTPSTLTLNPKPHMGGFQNYGPLFGSLV